MTTPLRIAVIGGGIGGLAAAVSLLRAEFEVDVYEQALELNEVGGGINMAPNAVRVLLRLGFAEGLDREGVRPRFTHQRRWQDGRTLQRAPLNPLCEELYGAPGDADPAETLREYERLRLPRVTLVQAMSRANKIRFHMPDGLAQRTRDAEWTRAGDRAPDALRWLYAFDAGAVVN